MENLGELVKFEAEEVPDLCDNGVERDPNYEFKRLAA